MSEDGDADDAALVQRAQQGEHAAFEWLVRRHQRRVRQQLRRLSMGDNALADDLAQECFVRAWQQLANFRGEARLSTWLHRIALNTYLTHRRRRREEPMPHEMDGGAAEAAAQAGPEAALQLDVARAVARLPEHERLAIVHCFQLDLSHEEAAEVLGLPLGTLKAQVARGKARLREALAVWSEG